MLLFSTGNLCPSPYRDRGFLLRHAFIELLNFKSCRPFKTWVLHLINSSDKLHSTYLSKSITTQSLLINSYQKLSWTKLFTDACLKNRWSIYLPTLKLSIIWRSGFTFLFSPLAFNRSIINKSHINLKYTTWWFDIHIHCKIFFTIKLINALITSHCYHNLCWCCFFLSSFGGKST